MGVLAIVNDPQTGTIYRNAGGYFPHSFDVVLQYTPDSSDLFNEPKQYTIKGLDSREYETANQVLQYCKYRLKVDFQPDPLTPAQRLAVRVYQQALQWLNHAQNLIDLQVVTEGASDSGVQGTLDMATRRTYVKDKYIACVQLGVYNAGNVADMD